MGALADALIGIREKRHEIVQLAEDQPAAADLYRRLREETRAEAAAAERAAPKKTAAPAATRPVDRPRRLTYKEQRELDAIEEAILEAEGERDRLGAELSNPELYADTPERVAPLSESLQEAERRVEALYARWAELEGRRARPLHLVGYEDKAGE